jgi:DNA-binding Lrp family transcriptional regulator
MTAKLTEIERRVLSVLQEGFPDSPTPYADMGARIGLDANQVLAVLKDWRDQGKLRRIGAIVNHFKVGMGGGAMVVWQVAPGRIEEIGKMLAGFKAVSHAYQRPAGPDWPYNLYTMVHGADAQDAEQTVKRMSEACGIEDYRLLITERELKKVAPTYIIKDEADRAKG